MISERSSFLFLSWTKATRILATVQLSVCQFFYLKTFKALPMRMLFLPIALFLWKDGLGQSKVTFGKVTLQELQMKSYEKDTSAAAVILSDIGKLDGRDLTFVRHFRIKILSKAGLDWGNLILNTPTKGDFSVYVFNLENNEIVKEKVDQSSIYTEEVINGLVVYKVFAPNVRVGSVIDIKYSFVGLPFEWRFQDKIPVVSSQITLEDNPSIKYTKTFFGFHPIETVSLNSWIAHDVPALKIEPFVNNYKNYISRFEIHLSAISIGGITVLDQSTWEKIVNGLIESPRFGKAITSLRFLSDVAKEIKESSKPEIEKIGMAYDYIKKNIKWNGVKSMYVSKEFKGNFVENHSGNSAEVNLSLINLLKKIGVDASPIILSTRDNGVSAEFFPSINKFNYVIAMILYEDKPLFIDATSENIGLGFLPEYCINVRGLQVKKSYEQWYTLSRKEFTDTKRQFVTVSLDGSKATAKIVQDFFGTAFINWMDKLRTTNFDSETRLAEISKDLTHLNFTNYELLKKDIPKCAGKESYEIDFSSDIIDTGDGFLLVPLFFFEYSSNPFRFDERKLPIDLIAEIDLGCVVLVNLPKNYEIEKIPQSIRFSTADGTSSFSFMVGASPNGLQYNITLKLNRTVFSQFEYTELKQFFTEVSKAINVPIELKKI
jgi:hypothetical protein